MRYVALCQALASRSDAKLFQQIQLIERQAEACNFAVGDLINCHERQRHSFAGGGDSHQIAIVRAAKPRADKVLQASAPRSLEITSCEVYFSLPLLAETSLLVFPR